MAPLPVSEGTLCMFVAFLANQDVSHRSIKSYLSGVRHLQISQGLQAPHIENMTQLEQVFEGD